MWTNKILDKALGNSFGQHLVGGYRFLITHYRPQCKIYIFGFSRGAYTARFLNEMLDYVGLVGPEHGELIPFLWEAFATWKLSHSCESAKRAVAYHFLRICRETVCYPICRVHFLGLFDTVNSIAEFQVDTETRPGARFIRHAVGIDERRVNFQPVLVLPGTVSNHHRSPHSPDPPTVQSAVSQRPELNNIALTDNTDEEATQDLLEVWFPGDHTDIGGGWKLGKGEQCPLSHTPLVWMAREAQRAGLRFDHARFKEAKCCGCENLSEDCLPVIRPISPVEVEGESEQSESRSFFNCLRLSSTKGLLHGRLRFGNGLSSISVLSWRFIEYLPFGRMHLQCDGSWKLIHWPLPRGAWRDIPANALIHGSAIDRMNSDPNYRPENLNVRSDRRGMGRAPKENGIGTWVCAGKEDDPVRQVWRRGEQ